MILKEKPIALEIAHVNAKDKSGNPIITLSAPIIPFTQGQIMYASIYDDKILMTPTLPQLID